MTACSTGGTPGTDGGEEGVPTVKLGYVGPLTGAYAAAGATSIAGFKAAIEYVNTLGVAKFELLERDSQGDPAQAAGLARDLAQEGVISITAGTGEIAPIQPVANQYGLFAVDSGGVTPLLPQAGDDREYPWVFCADPSCGAPGTAGQLQFVLDVGTSDKVAQLADTGAYGAGQVVAVDALVEAEFPDLEGKLVTETFPEDATSVTAELTRLRDTGADSIILWTYGAPLVMVMQSMDRIGWYPWVAAPLGAGEQGVIDATPAGLKGKIAAGGIAASQVSADAGAAPTGLYKEFFERYSEQIDHPYTGLDTVGSYAFDWVIILATAIEETGSTEPEELKAWITAGNEIETSQGPQSFGPSGDGRVGMPLANTTMYDPSIPCDTGMCTSVAAH